MRVSWEQKRKIPTVLSVWSTCTCILYSHLLIVPVLLHVHQITVFANVIANVIAYSSDFSARAEHHDEADVLLEDHSQEVVERFLHRALRRDVLEAVRHRLC